ncbi:MAG: hypothetical protein V1725_02915 [archaeon]
MKGQVKYYFEHVIRVLVLIFAFTAVILLIELYILTRLDVQEVSRDVLFYRIYYSPDLWESHEGLNRPNIGLISWDDISSSTLSGIHYTAQEHIAAKITFIRNDFASSDDHDRAPCTERNGTFAKTTYLNKALYTKLCPYVETGITGKGSASILIRDVPVTFSTIMGEERGTLLVHIITPNS